VRIYFDTCALNRPFDDKSQLRVALEAEAVLGLLALCWTGTADLIASDVIALENRRNPESRRKVFVDSVMEQATATVNTDDDIAMRANVLEQRGFRAFDALHVACAESAMVDYLCTCDDRLLRRARRQEDFAIKVFSPLELANEVSL
jgi:predicted nucleic acid-binding protein